MSENDRQNLAQLSHEKETGQRQLSIRIARNDWDGPLESTTIAADGVSIKGPSLLKSFGSDVVMFVVTFGANIAASVLANFISNYLDKHKTKTRSITTIISRKGIERQVTAERGEIERIVEEILQIHDQQIE
jgi:hypothetical protein